ncbi:MAG: fibronectin type III domain-containing protein [Ilumatobacteraceae bacterium]
MSRQDDTVTTSRERDAGSVLPLVLAMIVIGSLIVIPTMRYAITVLKANTVLSEKTMRIEGAKAGLRLSLADPVRLYDACGAGGPSTPVRLAPVSMGGVDVATDCYFIDYESAQSAEELRVGVTSTQVGTAPPEELEGSSWCAPSPSRTVPCDFGPTDPASSSEWLTQSTLLSETDKIWLPNLPVHGLNRRSPDGNQMPSGFPTCTVYFPGTYPDQVVLDGPTYFTSGIYYFENEVRIEGGASVVVGLGAVPGCTTDQEAIFYAENAPGTHNMSGLGGTWVLGAEGRVVVDNSNGSELSLRFNKRYVAPGDTGDAPSEDVSIVSVNGVLAPDGVTGTDLVAPGIIDVPASLVGSDTPVPATTQGYLPSVFTPVNAVALPPAAAAPNPPATPAAVPYAGTVRVSWAADPASEPVRTYRVTASPGGNTCEVDTSTGSALECDVAGLDVSTAYTFSVTAINEVGSSAPSAPSGAVIPDAVLGPPPPPSPAPPPAPVVPVSILEISLPAAAPATVEIPGYVAVPQGRVSLANPNGLAVKISGGVLAAQFDGSDARAAGPQTVPIGFLETIVQRKFRIVSTTDAGYETSTAIVQVNQNGAYAINSWEVQ